MAPPKVSPGAWVAVMLPPGTGNARMAVGDEPARAAFIENRPATSGFHTFALRRCPDLRPGLYRVKVTHDAGVAEMNIEII